jgi:flavin reductase (DIM6/NTAB) family NADH-FMN oxidoreductase RutF
MAASTAVRPPRVARSPIALECRYSKTVRLEPADGGSNPSSVVFGEVVGVHIADDVIVEGLVDIGRIRPLGRLGYMDYCVVDDVFRIDRPELPPGDLGRQAAGATKAG